MANLLQWFEKNILKWALWPKLIQVNKTDVYIIGGNDSNEEGL
jgi:hypothetical protein